MSNPVQVSRFEVKSHDHPDETRTPSRTRVEVVNVGGHTFGRFTFQPGWRWSECIKPVVKTDRCLHSHAGYVISGRLTVKLADGAEKTIGAGESYAIPPGHDAWVDGKEPFVSYEIMSSESYAKSR